jgi:hypothetical protein
MAGWRATNTPVTGRDRMGHLSWSGWKTCTSRISRLVAILLTAAALSAATASASALAAVHSPLAVPRLAAPLPDVCTNHRIPGTFCVASSAKTRNNFTYACSGVAKHVRTAAFHSKWYRFGRAGVPFHPVCIENPTSSTIWLENEATEVAICIHPHEGSRDAAVIMIPVGWFFVKYNINGNCNHEPRGEPH